jgi:hypothetical protein
MNPAKGYYSLIQYCPDMGRLEAANVGVLLFAPEKEFLQAVMASSNRRIRQFFGTVGHDWARINSFKQGLVERLEQERSDIRTLDDLHRFISLRANLLQITPPRPMRVIDPEEDLQQLARDFLAESVRKETRQNLKKVVHEKFLKAGLERKIRTDIQLEVPVLRRTVEIPFGFQNGRFNLLSVVPFLARQTQQSVDSACKYAVEGEALWDAQHPDLGKLQFCVLGDFRANDEETPARVEAVLDAHHVKLYRSDRIAGLISEIQQTGKDLPSKPKSA